jgi:protein-tyrosine phosphatase
VKLILNEVYPNQNYDIPDPYHDSSKGFENVFKMLDEATDIIKEKIMKG